MADREKRPRKPRPSRRKADPAASQLAFFFASTKEREARKLAKDEAPREKPKRRPPVTEEQRALGVPIQCDTCHKIKWPLFTPNPGHRVYGSHTRCRECRRSYDLQAAEHFGMTLRQYRAHQRAEVKRAQEGEAERQRKLEEGRRIRGEREQERNGNA